MTQGAKPTLRQIDTKPLQSLKKNFINNLPINVTARPNACLAMQTACLSTQLATKLSILGACTQVFLALGTWVCECACVRVHWCIGSDEQCLPLLLPLYGLDVMTWAVRWEGGGSEAGGVMFLKITSRARLSKSLDRLQYAYKSIYILFIFYNNLHIDFIV